VNVPKQASLMEHGVAATAITISSRAKKTEPPKLTAVILKLEPSIYGRCSLCNRWTILRFCLEYFNNEGDMLLWGEICEDCRFKSENSHRARFQKATKEL